MSHVLDMIVFLLRNILRVVLLRSLGFSPLQCQRAGRRQEERANAASGNGDASVAGSGPWFQVTASCVRQGKANMSLCLFSKLQTKLNFNHENHSKVTRQGLSISYAPILTNVVVFD
jgi:hypothetical protein